MLNTLSEQAYVLKLKSKFICDFETNQRGARCRTCRPVSFITQDTSQRGGHDMSLHCLFEGRRMTETDNSHFRFLARKLRENLFALVGRSVDGTQMIDLTHVKAYRSAAGAKGEKKQAVGCSRWKKARAIQDAGRLDEVCYVDGVVNRFSNSLRPFLARAAVRCRPHSGRTCCGWRRSRTCEGCWRRRRPWSRCGRGDRTRGGSRGEGGWAVNGWR